MTIGITLGDPTGIGPEVALKALARSVGEDDATRFVLIGDPGVVREHCGLLGLEADLPRWIDRASVASRVYGFCPTGDLPPGLPPGHPEAARVAVDWLTTAGGLALAGDLDAVVTGPVNKESILRAGIPFVGQTEHLATLAGCRRFGMMLLGPDDRDRWLRVLLATTHLPLRDVPAAVRNVDLSALCGLAAEACRRLGLPRARVAVCGLNPHAGEGGMLGTEDEEFVRPAVRAAVDAGWDVVGPIPADTVFHQALHGRYDVVVAWYHDQGLPALKLAAWDRGVNWTLGLPFVRTSPDHGTAFDIAGRGQASESSMLEAIRLARRVAAVR